MTMTKADLVKIICEKKGFVLKESTEIVNQVFDIMKETLEGGEKIKISACIPVADDAHPLLCLKSEGSLKCAIFMPAT